MLSMDGFGSLGGITFQRARGGTTVRRKPDVSGRLRTIQPSNRALLGYLATYWQSLAVIEKESWVGWAATHPQPDGFGGTFIMSGFNAFIHLNQAAMVGFSAVAPQDYAPTAPLLTTPKTLTAAVGPLSGEIDVDFTMNVAGIAADKVQIFTSDPHVGDGAYDSLKGWKIESSVAGNVLTKLLTGMIPGAFYGIRIRYLQEDGQRSSFLMATSFATV